MTKSTDIIRFFVDAIQNIFLVLAVLKGEYTFSLLVSSVGLLSAKLYANITDILRKKRQ